MTPGTRKRNNMLALTDPHEAYRRSEIDARIHGSDPQALVSFCLDQAIAGLSHAVIAFQQGNATIRSKALTRALTAVTALEMGVDRTAPMAEPLLQLYGSARKCLLDSVLSFNADGLLAIRDDFAEIRAAFSEANS